MCVHHSLAFRRTAARRRDDRTCAMTATRARRRPAAIAISHEEILRRRCLPVHDLTYETSARALPKLHRHGRDGATRDRVRIPSGDITLGKEGTSRATIFPRIAFISTIRGRSPQRDQRRFLEFMRCNGPPRRISGSSATASGSARDVRSDVPSTRAPVYDVRIRDCLRSLALRRVPSEPSISAPRSPPR